MSNEQIQKLTAERDAALAVIEQMRAACAVAEDDSAHQIEGAGWVYAGWVAQQLAQPPVFALAKVKADTLREAASKHFTESIAQGLGDPTAVAEWLRSEADRIEREATE